MTSPRPIGGDNGEIWVAPTPGDTLVKILGLQDIKYDRGQQFAEAHGMDAAHGFDVPVKSKPSIKAKRIVDFDDPTLFECRANTEAGQLSLFVHYPDGGRGNYDDGVAGSCWVKTDTSQSLKDAVSGDVEFVPALGDWANFGAYAGD